MLFFFNQNEIPTNNSIDKTFPLCTFHNHWCMPTQAHLLWIISDNIWIGLVIWHRLDVYNKKLSIHNKCAWVGIHQWLWKVHKGSVLSIELFVGN
jgi:hypothetical protein